MNLPEPSAGASAFPKFLDAFFAWYYQTLPVNATFIGVHDYDDRLPDYSERGIGAALAAIDTLLARVRVFATRRCLSARSWIAGWSRDSWRSSAGSSGPRTFTRGIRACMRP